MKLIFFVSILMLYYVYDGYLRVLRIAATIFPQKQKISIDEYYTPEITVLITVFNEQGAIINRIDDIFSCDYPSDKVNVVIASDGSTDSTDMLVKGYTDSRARLFRSNERLGKTHTINIALETINSEIVVFTDADSRFHKQFLKEIVKPFSDTRVGCVSGNLQFIRNTDSGISRSQSAYWDYELAIRQFESDLGILAVAAGACLAIRRDLFKPMPIHVGEDCRMAVDIALQGYRIIHASGAIAYDTMDNDPHREFQNRVRMTLRNWQGIWAKPNLLNPFHWPGYAFSLWSHKLLRWLSPLFLMGITLSALYLAFQGEGLFQLVTVGLICFYLSGIIGVCSSKISQMFPFTAMIYSFLVANFGFLVGLIKALFGVRINAYRND